MISPEYIKGYIAALRTVQTAVEALQETRIERRDNQFDPATIEAYLMSLIQFIENNRQTYKELVDKLNKENSNAD